MGSNQALVAVAEASGVDRTVLGGKAAVLAELLAAGFPVPPGIVVTAAALDDPDLDTQLASLAGRLGGDRFAVRSSGAAEDLADASYAGLYETYLNVPPTGLGDAVRRCFAAAVSERVTAYHDRHGGGAAAMAVLVQAMVDPRCAGVAFTAHPVTGDRNHTVVTAVAGLGDPLVSGETTGEEWTISSGGTAAMTRPAPEGDPVLTGGQAAAVAQLARRVADRHDGRPPVRHLVAASARRRLPRRHAGHRRGAGAVPVRPGQRLVLQRHPDPVAETPCADPGAWPHAGGEDLVQRVDPGQS